MDGKFPGRDKTKTLAQQVAPLAGETGEYKGKHSREKEVIVKENWREVLRLIFLALICFAPAVIS